jgi:hypothetical protein
MKYDMKLISHDELKRKLERKNHFKLVMALAGYMGVPCEAYPRLASLSHARGSSGLAHPGR